MRVMADGVAKILPRLHAYGKNAALRVISDWVAPVEAAW